MPSWKKVIVSGSNAVLNQITASGNFVSDGTVIITGNTGRVGINTLAPDYKLDVAGNAGFNEYLYHNGDSNTYLRYQSDKIDLSAGGNVFQINNRAISGSLTSTGSFGRVEASIIGGNSPLEIESDNFNVSSDGVISGSGISTGSFGHILASNIRTSRLGGKSPLVIESDNFNVDDVGTYSGSATSTGSFGNIQAGDGSGFKTISGNGAEVLSFLRFTHGGGHFLESGTNSLAYKSSGGTNNFSINASSGNVFIKGNTEVDGVLQIDGTGTNIFAGDVSGSSTSTGSFGSLTLADAFQGTLRVASEIRLLATGAVSSPNFSHYASNHTTRLNEFKIMGDNSTILKTSGAYNLRFGTNDVDRLMIQQGTGNVGIGTTSPGAKLTVHGDISGSLTSTGSFGNIQVDGDFLPTTDNNTNLGSPSKRFANIHSADLQLSNEGTEGNDVDGTTGNWTLQEGEEDIYLINNKTGKKYSIMLKEVKQ